MSQLDWKQCRIYLALLKLGDCSVSALAEEAAVDERHIYGALDPLCDQDIVAWDASNERGEVEYALNVSDGTGGVANCQKVLDLVEPFLRPLSEQEREVYDLLTGMIVFGVFTTDELAHYAKVDLKTAQAQMNMVEELNVFAENDVFMLPDRDSYEGKEARRKIVDRLTPYFLKPKHLMVPRSYEFQVACEVIMQAVKEGEEDLDIGGFHGAERHLVEALKIEGGDQAPKPIRAIIRHQQKRLARVRAERGTACEF